MDPGVRIESGESLDKPLWESLGTPICHK